MGRFALIWAVVFIVMLLTSVAALAETEKSTVLQDVEFARIGERKLLMNLTLPPGAPQKRFPAIIHVHGGGWCMGDHNADLTQEFGLNGQGFATGSITYRLSQEAPYPAQIHDCKAAIRFLRANAAKYGIDPERIGVWGGSAGGHLVALLGTTAGISLLEGDSGNLEYSSRVQAVCDMFGPTDFSEVALKEYTSEVMGMVTALFGGPVEEHRGLARMASPVEFVSKDDPPMLILHGDQDTLVPMSQSEAMYKALKRVGADVTLVKVKNTGHGFIDYPVSEPTYKEIKKMVLDFFCKHLGVR